MPIRRLLCVLFLLSAPALAQTVSFIDGAGAGVDAVLENTEVRVRVTDPAAGTPSAIDTVEVTLSAALSGDSEPLTLWETDRDSGAFEGRIRLSRGLLQAGVLEAGFAAGPPAVYDTLTAEYGAATDTAAVAPARLRLLDEHGRPATAYTDGDWIHVRLEDHLRANDPWMRDTVTVTVWNPDISDDELVTLEETALRTGVFEGRIRHVYTASSSGDGILGGYPPQQIHAGYDVPDVTEDLEVSVPLVGSRIEILGGEGRPVTLVAEASLLRLRVTHRSWANNSVVDTEEAMAYSLLTGDEEPVALTETGPTTGIFEGTIPMSLDPAQTGDGTLQTGEDLGPPHRFDEVSVSYVDNYNYSGTVWATAATYGSETRFTDAEGRDAEGYPAGSPFHVRVEDHVANQPGSVDSFPVSVESLTQGDSELLVLTETGQDTAIFSGSMLLLSDSGSTPGDGILQGELDDTLRVLHGDGMGYTASGDLARVRGTRIQFIDADGQAVGEVLENGTVRVRVEMAVCNGSPYSIDTCPLVLTTRIHGDAESLSIPETGENTGVFVTELPAPLAFYANPYNGALEIGTSGSPEYLPDVITASAGPDFASVPTAPFRLRFVHADGGDAPAFAAGEAVGLRLEDHTGNDPQVLQAETLQVHLFSSPEAEVVSLTETGYDTGVYVGTVPSQLSSSPSLNNGTLEVEIGSRLLVERSSASDFREIRDEAVVGGTAVAADSPVRFLDAYGNETDSYTAGSTAHVRVEDHVAGSNPAYYDYAQVTLTAPMTGDSETTYLRETTRDSGVFTGSLPLGTGYASTNDGTLQANPGEDIQAAYTDAASSTSFDLATIRYSSAEFVDEDGVPTGEVLENGVARLRVTSASPGSTVDASVTSSRAADQVTVTLTETFPGSQVYEGTVQLSFVAPGGGMGNSLLETSTSGSPDYLGDDLTVTYQDGVGHAVTIPSRVRFIDGYGRVTTTFAVGERVGVRVEDHNLDDPQYKEQIQVLVHEVGSGDASSVTLIETGFDTNVYEGSIATEDAPVAGGDGKLQVAPGQVIQAERLNQHTPYPTVAQATMAGAAVVFIDAEGRPAELYYERTRAYVRVSDTFAASSITVTLQTFLGLDSESLTLTETGPSTGVFEGSIPLLTGGSSNQNNGYLETSQYGGPPVEYDTLTASYQSVSGTVSGTVGMIGSRTWFVDAYGNETDSYTAGTTAHVRVEDHVAGSNPAYYDYAQVTLTAPMTGDSEATYLRETTRDSGIFEGPVSLGTGTASSGDGRLQAAPGEEIEVVHEEQAGDGESSDTAVIRYSSAEFIDEAGVPTGEVLENGVARLRVTSASPGSTVDVSVTSSRAADQVTVTLTETFPGSQVYEGSVQLSFVAPGGGMGNSLLETSTSGSPDYLGDELTVTYQDGVGRAVTIPSRVRFIDGYGRVTTTFAVGERVGVRVEDHNLDDPQYKEQIQVLVHEVGSGDANSVTLIETGFDTNVYEGSIATEDAPVAGGDGKLQVAPGQVIQAERLNQHTPYPTVAQATMSGASVVFIDAEGRPAELYYERTRAYVRVSDTFAASSITVTLQTFLGLDSESLTLTETGPSTGVFEGSIPLLTGGSSNQNNGYLETGQYGGPPVEYDTLTATYQSVSGTVSGTAGITGSRTWFVDAYGNLAESYTAGTTAHVRVEDHVAGSNPAYYDYAQVTLTAPTTGDSETTYLRETTRDSGIFEGAVSLGTGTASSGDGRLQAAPGEEIEVVHEEQAGDGESSDMAVIRYSSAEFIDGAGEPTGEVLENGVARLRVISASPGSTVDVSVTSSRAADQVTVTLAETSPGSKVYEGSVQLSFVPPGGGMGNSLLETSTSGSPDYLGDELTVTYQDGVGHAVTIPSRVRFIDGYGRVTTTFAVGERVGVQVEDHNLDDPQIQDQMQVLVREIGQGDADSVTLIETGFDTNVYEGSIATEDAAVAGGDGKLQLVPGQVIEAERLNQHTPYPTRARATMAGAAVLFIDAEGKPADLYYEGTRAYVRVSDTFAANSITVTLQSFLGLDSESLTLTETGSSTGVFEGSIPLSVNSASQNNGVLETAQYSGPPTEFDVLTASYQSVAGTVSDTAGTLGSRTWFVDAYGNETDSYTAGTTVHVRVEDHVNGSNPAYYDYAHVTLTAPTTGDSETTYLRETTRDSGIFEGPVSLGTGTASSGDGRLQSTPGEEIEVVHLHPSSSGSSSDKAVIRYSFAEFIDEAGEPTGEVLENGVARLRVTSASPGSTVDVSVTSSRAADQVTVTLAETSPGSKVYEGSVQLSFVPPGGGMGNSLLETSTSGSPDYLGDELTVTYQDGVGHAVTIPSRVRFIDGYGRVTTTFAVGERVGVRVEDHNLDDPQIQDQMQVLVREIGQGDADSVTLIETGFDTNVYEGSIATEDAPAVGGDGKLQLVPGQVIEAERLNQHTPYPTRTRATMAGASVLFIDAQGQPAELYYEGTRAYVRVSDTFAANSITVTLQTFFGLDSESLTLTETGPSTGVFEGSIPLSLNSATQNNGVLETAQYSGPPTEFDVLTAAYPSIAGTVSDTAGTLGSRTWFVDAYGNETDSYTAGTTAHVRVENHVAGSNPAYYDYTQVTLYSLATGDTESLYLMETTRESGVFEGPVSLGTGTASSGDGRLQSAPGEEIEVVHHEPAGTGISSDRAVIRYSSAEFIDEAGEPTGEVLENGVARLRVVTASPGSTVDVSVTSSRAADQVTVTLPETFPGSQVYEGSVQLSFVPPGGGMGNGLLETSTSGSPDYLGDELTLTYQDGAGHAVTIPSRITFLAYAENWPVTEYAVGSDIRVRVQDRNANDPSQVDTTWVLATAPGDSEGIALTETGADTGIFEGTLPSSGSPGSVQDGTLTAGPGTVASVEHLNVHTPNPTTAQVTFNGNFAPLAVDDTAQTEEEQPVTIDVLANDSDPDQEPLAVGWPTQAAHGTVSVVTEGIVYTPEAGFIGTDSFTYVASDPRGGESRGTVTVTVLQGNEPPVAEDDSVTLAEDGAAVAVDVLANDSDPDDDPLEVTLLTQPAHGTAALQPDDTILYTPNPDFYGNDGFTYQVEDPDGATDTATVNVTVTPVNDPPVAVDDSATVAEDGSATVTVLANDTDVENDTLDVTAVTQGAHGAVVLNANDTATYTPAANFSGSDSFTYTVSDGNGGTDTATVTMTVTPANDPPVAADDTATTDEDTAVTIAVLANDTDLDNDVLDVTSTTGALHGSAVVNADETVTFTPAAGFHGTATFDYVMSDGHGGSDVGTVTITVNPVNDPPVANDDTAVTDEDSSVSVSVLDNDTDEDDDTLEVTAVTQGTHGAVTLDPVTYTPAANFNGTDSFTYTVSDGTGGGGGGGGTDTATVTVTVNAVNDAPVAGDDTATVAEDSSVTVNVLGNDTDDDNDTLDVTAVTQGTNGAVTLDPVTYTPNANFHGTDSFTYTVSDGNGGTDTATVTVTITPVNDAPIANDDTASVVEDDSVTVNVLGNDTDVDNDTLTVTAVTQGAHGTVTLDPVTYTPSPNYFGSDSFTYTISDGNGGVDTATVTVTVAPSNDNLTASDDSATVAEDGSVTVAVLGNDSDPENDVLSIQSVTQGTNGSVAIVGTQVTYTPNADFHGADSFTYTASDGNGGTDSATVTITVTPVNDAPVAGDDTASVVEDGSVAITVLGNDADVDDDLLSVTSATQGTHGSVVVNPDDTVTYTPEADYNGADSFTYTISDGNGGEDTATVNVTVGAANDAPVASDDSASTAEDNPVTVSVLGNDTDLENDTLSVSAVTQGTNGSVAIAGSQVTYTPGANFNGTDSFTYTVSDGNGGTDTATVNVTVTPVNDAPVANDDPASVAEDGSVTVAVLANDTDADNDTLTVTAVTQGAHGAVTLNPVTYTPAANYNGADSFTYTVSDGNGGTDTATVNVTVGAANDAPVANDDTATVAEDGSVTVAVLGNDTDLDNDTLTVSAVTQGAHGTVTLSPVTYTPAANYNGPDSFTYTASDGNGGTATATVTVTVTAVNDAPVAANDSATTLAETAVTIAVRNNDTDIDSATLTITAVTQGAHGTVAINGGLTVTYTPATAWIGPDTFTYTISDGAGGTATATVSMTVQAPPRVSTNIQVLYAFNEGSGTTVNDTSGVGTPLNLTIGNAAAVTWLPGALSINSNTLVQTAGIATKVINACKASNEVTVEAWVDPLNLTQTGPAAIVTISQTHTKRDVTLGQSATAYSGQLRTSTTGQDGTQTNTGAVATLNLSHVVYTRSSTGAVRIYVDGTQVATGTLAGNLSSWSNYNLALGGELSGTRYWRGELHLVAIYSRALTATEVRQNWLAGAN